MMQHNHYAEEAITTYAKPTTGIEKPLLKILSSFPFRLHQILDDADKYGETDIVCWKPHGKSFIIKDSEKFVKQVMSRYFNHGKFTSFQRQLNLYGFQRLYVGNEKGAYYHEFFVRGHSDLSRKIVRQKVNGKKVRQSSKRLVEPNFYSEMNDGLPATIQNSSPREYIFNRGYQNQSNTGNHHQQYHDRHFGGGGGNWQDRLLASTRPNICYNDEGLFMHPSQTTSYHDSHNIIRTNYPPDQERNYYQDGKVNSQDHSIVEKVTSSTTPTISTIRSPPTPEEQLLQMKEKKSTLLSSPITPAHALNSVSPADEAIYDSKRTSCSQSPSLNKKFKTKSSFSGTGTDASSNMNQSTRWKMYFTKEDVLKGMVELSDACKKNDIDCSVLQHVLPRQLLDD